MNAGAPRTTTICSFPSCTVEEDTRRPAEQFAARAAVLAKSTKSRSRCYVHTAATRENAHGADLELRRQTCRSLPNEADDDQPVSQVGARSTKPRHMPSVKSVWRVDHPTS